MNLTRLMFSLVLIGAVFTVRAHAAEAPAHKAEPAAAHSEAGEEHEPDRNPMAFDPDLAIFSAIIFLLLVAILGKFAWPTITAALDERERKISDHISAAEARDAESKRLFAEHEAKLAAAAGEVRAMLEEARRDAEQVKKSIEADGQKAAKEELDRSLREIHRARDAAVQELAVSSANTAIDLAKKIIHEGLTPEKNNQIIREAMAKLAAETSKN
jgi:F-type H+-transporting ATPase subunit b